MQEKPPEPEVAPRTPEESPSPPPAAPVCGGTRCPPLAGYTAACNTQGACEYAYAGERSGWRRHDVWVYVPAGTWFWQGSPAGERGRDSDEGPVRKVTVGRGYLLGKYEVTVAQYEACAAARKCTPLPDATPPGSRADHPQTGLTWAQAQAVCAFLGGGLPSESQWELGANGPGAHRRFPWGEEAPGDDHANLSGDSDGHSQTAPVGTYPSGASPFGALDMAGDVWEWVADPWHDNYASAPTDGSVWGDSGSNRVKRGGGFANVAGGARVANRVGLLPGWRNADLGARCSRPHP